MVQKPHSLWYSVALVAGLSLWTLAPYGGCSCENPLGGSTPAGIQQLYGGNEAGKVPSTLVDDFNDGATSTSATGHWQNVYIAGKLTQVWFNGNDPAFRVNFWGGGTYTQADSFGSVYSSQMTSASVSGEGSEAGVPAVGDCLQYGCATCLFGRTYPPDTCSASACGQVYPFIQHGMFLSPGGANGDADVEFTGVNGTSTTGYTTTQLSNGTHGLMLNIYPNSNSLIIKVILLYLYNYTHSVPCTYGDTYAYHQYTVAGLTVGQWNSKALPFSDFKLMTHGCAGCTANTGTNLVYGTGADSGTLANSAAWVDGSGAPINTLRVMAIEFDPAGTIGSGTCSPTANNFQQEPYYFLIDNVEFY